MVLRKACRGELPVSLQERIEILVVLAAGGEGENQRSAFHTLESWPSQELQQVVRDPSTAGAVLDFVATSLGVEHKELRDALLQNPSLAESLRNWLETVAGLLAEAESSEPSEVAPPIQPVREGAGASHAKAPPKQGTVLQRTHEMSVVEKVKTALTGNAEERLILVRDSNKLVARAVMQSAKLSEHEVETFAAMKDVCEEVLRLIAGNRKFLKMYVVVRALVNNPRTPIDVGLPLLKRTNDQDLRHLIFNRNVPDVIRRTAQKMIRQKEEAAKAKFPGRPF